MKDSLMPRKRAQARAQAKAQALPASGIPLLWSIGTLLSAVVLYLIWVS
jgi:hypothetical protein